MRQLITSLIMKREEQSTQTQTDKTVIKLLQGRDGRDGAQGIKGDVGECGEKGDQGKTGQKGEPAGGVAYVRWGHDSWPNSTGAQLVYIFWKSWWITLVKEWRW